MIETENLGMAGIADLEACLQSLAAQELPIDTASEVLLVVGARLEAADLERITRQFPFVRVHETGGDISYVASKRQGCEMVHGELVLFADSDVVYAPGWTRLILKAFEDQPQSWVALADTRLKLESSYALAMQLAWMLPVLERGEDYTEERAFRLNNFGIPRERMLSMPFQDDLPLYRGSLIFWRRAMLQRGAVFTRVPLPLATHGAPPGVAEWFLRMLIFGADSVARADYELGEQGLAEKHPSTGRRAWRAARFVGGRLANVFRRLVLLVSEDRRLWRFVPLGLPLALVSVLVSAVGCVVAIFRTDLIYQRIVAFESAEG